MRILILCICVALTIVGATWTGFIGAMKPQSLSIQSAQCPGDFKGDGRVNLADFLAFAGGFGTRSGDANFDARTEVDGSGAQKPSAVRSFGTPPTVVCDLHGSFGLKGPAARLFQPRPQSFSFRGG